MIVKYLVMIIATNMKTLSRLIRMGNMTIVLATRH